MKKLAGLLILICFLLSTWGLAGANEINPQVYRILLQDGDMKGLKIPMSLNNTLSLKNTWPVVRKLPKYMENPENPTLYSPTTDPLKGNTSPLSPTDLNPVEMEAQKNDGIRQNWRSSDNQQFITVDYGYYDTPKQARDSLVYIVYERTIPNFSSYWYPTTGYQTNGYANYPVCRRLNYGDLSYFVSAVGGGGGSIYFVKGNYIFMVDSVMQDLEDSTVQSILNKFQLNK